jgi:uncharacterized membrane protein YqjE
MPGVAAKTEGSSSVDLLDAVRAVRMSGSLLLDHAALGAELVGVEWAEERARLRRSLLCLVLGAILLGLTLLQLDILVMLAFWQTPYRVTAAALLTLLFGAGLALAWRNFQRLGEESTQAFAGSREQLGRTIQLLRSRL